MVKQFSSVTFGPSLTATTLEHWSSSSDIAPAQFILQHQAKASTMQEFPRGVPPLRGWRGIGTPEVYRDEEPSPRSFLPDSGSLGRVPALPPGELPVTQ